MAWLWPGLAQAMAFGMHGSFRWWGGWGAIVPVHTVVLNISIIEQCFKTMTYLSLPLLLLLPILSSSPFQLASSFTIPTHMCQLLFGTCQPVIVQMSVKYR